MKLLLICFGARISLILELFKYALLILSSLKKCL